MDSHFVDIWPTDVVYGLGEKKMCWKTASQSRRLVHLSHQPFACVRDIWQCAAVQHTVADNENPLSSIHPSCHTDADIAIHSYTPTQPTPTQSQLLNEHRWWQSEECDRNIRNGEEKIYYFPFRFIGGTSKCHPDRYCPWLCDGDGDGDGGADDDDDWQLK